MWMILVFCDLNCMHKNLGKKCRRINQDSWQGIWKMPIWTIDNAFITLMAQMNKILCHGKATTFLSCTQIVTNMRKIWKSIFSYSRQMYRCSSLPVVQFPHLVLTMLMSVATTKPTTKAKQLLLLNFNTKTEQAVFEAALMAPVLFHQQPNDKGYYSL